MAEVMAADEALITSSLRDVEAIHRWDSTDFRAAHPLTDEIAATFASRSSANLDPYRTEEVKLGCASRW